MSDENTVVDVVRLLDANKTKPDVLGIDLIEDSKSGITPFMVVPDHYKVEDMEQYLPAPVRIRQSVTLHDEASFVSYVKEFQDDNSMVFAGLAAHGFKCVLDYHTKEAPERCTHTATYICSTTKEWDIWTGSDSRKMKQAEYANFIENNLPDIYRPDAAEMLEMITDISSKTAVNFQQKYDISNGRTTLHFSESSAQGDIALPNEFVLRFPVFKNGEAKELHARQRVRIRDGELTLWYDLKQPHKVIESTFDEIVSSVAAQLEMPILLGSL